MCVRSSFAKCIFFSYLNDAYILFLLLLLVCLLVFLGRPLLLLLLLTFFSSRTEKTFVIYLIGSRYYSYDISNTWNSCILFLGRGREDCQGTRKISGK